MLGKVVAGPVKVVSFYQDSSEAAQGKNLQL